MFVTAWVIDVAEHALEYVAIIDANGDEAGVERAQAADHEDADEAQQDDRGGKSRLLQTR